MDGAAQGVRPPGKSCHAINSAFIFCYKNKISVLATCWWFRGIISAPAFLSLLWVVVLLPGASAGWQGRRILFLLSGAQAGWAHFLSKSKEMTSYNWCLQTGQQEQASQALKVNKGEDWSLADSLGNELREACDEDLIERISLDSSSHSSSGSSWAQEGAVFSNTKCYLNPSPPKNPSPASAVDVAARPWKTRNHWGIKIPSQEEDRQCTQKCQSKAHQENSAQPLDKEPALLGLHSMMAASGSQRQCQPVGCTNQPRPIPGPAAVGSPRIRSIMDESPSKEIDHQHPACSSTTLQRFRPMNSVWPLTARSILQSLPHKSSATKTSQNRSPQS